MSGCEHDAGREKHIWAVYMCTVFRLMINLCKIMQDSKFRAITQTIHTNLLCLFCDAGYNDLVSSSIKCMFFTVGWLFMFPWQHIIETALMRNGTIQLSNDVTVTMFLNQSLQTFEVFLEMISGTSVQNFSRRKCFILRQNWVLEIINDVTVTSFCNQ